jgi:Fur family peroxide stress response transcriptional regulator
MTVQRRAILAALQGRTDHPTADRLYASVRRRVPGLSRTTVYRVLDALVRNGLVARIQGPGAAERYDARMDRHHHAVCTRCERILDVEDARLDRLPLPRVAGFRVADYSVYYSGVCRRKHG